MLWNCSEVNDMQPDKWEIDIGSGNGLVSWGYKPLPEAMLNQFYVTTWHH